MDSFLDTTGDLVRKSSGAEDVDHGALTSELSAGNSSMRRVFPGCTGSNDVWQINENKELYNWDLPTALTSCVN